MIPLSPRTRSHVDRMFDGDDRAHAEEMLTEGCGADLPLWHDLTPEGLERIRFAVLKLSGGDLARLGVYLREAQTDWRDVLVAADFADDVEAHARWKPSHSKRSNCCGGCCGVKLVLLLSFWVWYVDPFAPKFDFERWRAENGKHVLFGHYPRRKMADRLRDSDRLIGLSRVEVRALLGEPPSDEQYIWMDDHVDVYRVGPERGWAGIDSEWLLVRFDEHGRCDGVLIITD